MRALLRAANLPAKFWEEAWALAVWIRNCTYTKAEDITPYEKKFGTKPDISQLRVFGCKAYVLVRDAALKLAPRTIPCIYMGPTMNLGTHRLWNPATRKFINSRDVVFDEGSYLYGKAEDQYEDPFAIIIIAEGSDAEAVQQKAGPLAAEHIIPPSDSGVSAPSEITPTPQVMPVTAAPTAPTPAPTKPKNLTISKREMKALTTAYTIYEAPDDPKTFKKAMSGPETAKWKEATDTEMESHRIMGTFKEKLVDLPEGATAIPSKWVFRKKRSADGTVIRYKARLYAQGNHEQGAEELDSYSPVARITSIRILLTIAHRLHYVVYQMDVETAYLYGKLERPVYMRQPQGYIDPAHPNKVLHVLRGLYGIYNAGKLWNIEIDRVLKELGFISLTNVDLCVYFRIEVDGTCIFFTVYVDDCLCISQSKNHKDFVLKQIQKSFKLKDMGEVMWILGIAIQRNQFGFCLS